MDVSMSRMNEAAWLERDAVATLEPVAVPSTNGHGQTAALGTGRELARTRSPLRVLFVQETNWIDRNIVHQHHLAERLVRRGHHVAVIDYDILWSGRQHQPRWRPREVFDGVARVIDGVSLRVVRPATIQLPLISHATWASSSLVELRRQLRDGGYDVVIGLTLTNSYPMALLLRRWGIPYVSMVLEPYHTMVPQRWLWSTARLMERRALQAADKVVVFTPQMLGYVQQMGVSPEQVALLKTGVSLDLFHPDVDGSQHRRDLDIGPGQWLVFFMGWLYAFSGLRQITRAIGEDPGLLNGARLVIVGDGDLHDELRNTVRQYGIGDRVIMTGRRPYEHIPSLLAASDVCVLPSLLNDTTREIVPMKVYEYLAAGKPVVASRLPGLMAEFGNDAGILYADDPVDTLRQAVALAGEPQQARALGEAGRRVAEENADWESTVLALEALLLQVTERQGAGAHA